MCKRTCVVQSWMTLAVIAALFPLSSVMAKTVSHTASVPLTKTNWSNTLQFPKFTTGSGALSKVSFFLHSDIQGTLEIESLDSATGTVISTLGTQLTLKRPDSSTLLTFTPSDQKTDDFHPFDGTVNYSGPSGATHTIASSGTGTAVLLPITAADLALFGGSGLISLPITAQGISTFSGGGNIHSISTLFASARVTVRYEYATPDLAIQKVASGSLIVGSQGVFVLTIRNVGSGATLGPIVVRDTLPSGLTFVSMSASGWSCSGTQSLTCTSSGTLAAGATLPPVVMRVAIDANAIPSVTNTASVTTPGDIDEHGGVNISSLSFSPEIPPTDTPGGGGGGGSGGGGGRRGSGGGSGGGPPSSPPLSTFGAYGGPKDETSPLADALGCEIPKKYVQPLEVSQADSCLEFVPDRPIAFTDTAGNPARTYIDTLKNTRIRATGDFIVSGDGNHSSGKQQSHFQSGNYPFAPSRGASRMEVMKIALIANCIPIDNELPSTDAIFKDVPLNRSDDELQDFIARVVYTAAKHGVAKGGADGTVRPLEPATNAETLALLLRASHAMPEGYALQSTKNWYEPELQFAIANHIVDASFDPDGLMDRATLSALLVHIMSLSSNPQISQYIAQLNVAGQQFLPRSAVYLPLPQIGALQPVPGIQCPVRVPKINACLGYDSSRNVAFSDLTAGHAAFKAIDLLRKTFIVATGDFVFSGTGNHSTGKQQTKYQKGSWEFQPDRPATRLEVVKTALVANCIPVLDELPNINVNFTDLPRKRTPDDDTNDFAARVFYTAALHGIVTGYKDGTALPYEPATKLETVAMLLRAAKIVPDGYVPQRYTYSDLPFGTEWYAPTVSFAAQNGLVQRTGAFHPDEPILRSSLAALLTDAMAYSADVRVRTYRTSVDALVK